MPNWLLILISVCVCAAVDRNAAQTLVVLVPSPRRDGLDIRQRRARSPVAAKAHWPGYATLQEMFPNLDNCGCLS